MALKEVTNEGDYKSAISSSNLVAVHFQAPWAPECETVSAVLQVVSSPVSRGVYFSKYTFMCRGVYYSKYKYIQYCTIHFCEPCVKSMSCAGIAEGGWTYGQA